MPIFVTTTLLKKKKKKKKKKRKEEESCGADYKFITGRRKAKKVCAWGSEVLEESG